jgi:hypothetical protein
MSLTNPTIANAISKARQIRATLDDSFTVNGLRDGLEELLGMLHGIQNKAEQQKAIERRVGARRDAR